MMLHKFLIILSQNDGDSKHTQPIAPTLQLTDNIDITTEPFP